jgi:predicted ATPase
VDFARAKEMLVILDNCEHVLGVCAQLVDDLLRNCDDIRVLATSRQNLDIEGESVFRLDSLPVGDPSGSYEAIARSDAVRLFVDRAASVRRDFVLDESSARAVAEISRRLDGAPLAIELAAARAYIDALIGDIESARANALTALSLARAVGNPSELASALWAAGVTTVRDMPDQALDFVEESIALMRAGASGAVLGHVLAMRAQLRVQAGDRSGGLADLREAVLFSRDKGDTVMLTVSVDRGLVVLGRLGRWQAVAVLSGVITGEGALAAVSTMSRMEKDDRTLLINQAQVELDPAAFESWVGRGSTMAVDDVVAFVVAELGVSSVDAPGT